MQFATVNAQNKPTENQQTWSVWLDKSGVVDRWRIPLGLAVDNHAKFPPIRRFADKK